MWMRSALTRRNWPSACAPRPSCWSAACWSSNTACASRGVRQAVVGALIPEALSEELQAPAGSAALKIVRRYLDTDGELMDLSVTLHPASRYTLHTQLDRDLASV